MNENEMYLDSTFTMDYNSALVQEFVDRNIDKSAGRFNQVLDLYRAVRDEIRYDPYCFSLDKVTFKASYVVERGASWCVPKSVLYTACCRRIGVPARLGFADVRNHLSTANMREKMKTDIFYWHGYTSVFLKGKWVKATTAFNKELCLKFGLVPLEFDGVNDSLYHPFDKAGNLHMEYIQDRGAYNDVPFKEMFEDLAGLYPNELSDDTDRDFEQEVMDEMTKG